MTPRHSWWAAVLLPLVVFPGVASADNDQGEDAPARLVARGLHDVRLADGRRQTKLDLAAQVSGCTGQVWDPDVDRRSPAPVSFELVGEEATLQGRTVLIVATAPGGCNVQGHCGAGFDVTLFAVSLTERLALREMRSYVVEDCKRALMMPDADDEAEIAALLAPRDGVTRVRLEQARPDGGSDFSELSFDLRHPERGFTLTPQTPP